MDQKCQLIDITAIILIHQKCIMGWYPIHQSYIM